MKRIGLVVAYDGTNYCGWEYTAQCINIEVSDYRLLSCKIFKWIGASLNICKMTNGLEIGI